MLCVRPQKTGIPRLWQPQMLSFWRMRNIKQLSPHAKLLKSNGLYGGPCAAKRRLVLANGKNTGRHFCSVERSRFRASSVRADEKAGYPSRYSA
jgi:hypothetical protein